MVDLFRKVCNISSGGQVVGSVRLSFWSGRRMPGTIDVRYRFAVSPKTVNSATPGVMPFGAPRMTSRAALPGVGRHSR